MSEQLKLEGGKFYRTRDGRKAYVSCIVEPSPFGECYNAYNCIGFIHGIEIRQLWNPNGCREGLGRPYPEDLIAEWREPASSSVDVMLVRNAAGVAVCVAGNGLSHPRVLARKTVTLTEGDGV